MSRAVTALGWVGEANILQTLQLASLLAPSCNLQLSPVDVESNESAFCHLFLTSRGRNVTASFSSLQSFFLCHRLADILVSRTPQAQTLQVSEWMVGGSNDKSTHTVQGLLSVNGGTWTRQDAPSAKRHVGGSPLTAPPLGAARSLCRSRMSPASWFLLLERRRET